MLNNYNTPIATDGSRLMRDSIYDRMRADILACVLAPGALVQEKDLATRYDVSKSPVRDALLRLQEQGLIEVMPRKGYRIRPISVSDGRELYEIRLLLERACIKRAIDNAENVELARLDHFRLAEENGGLTEWVAYNKNFHRAIAQLSGNIRLTRMTQDIIDQFDRLTYMGVVTAPSDASSEKLVEEHCGIIDAIQARDKTTAGRLITGHVVKSQKRFFTVFENPPIVK